jgi:hypothetical protein
MTEMSPCFRTARELSAMLRPGEVPAREMTRRTRAR